MAVTVEELQIVLGVDATKAQATLDALNQKVNAAANRIGGMNIGAAVERVVGKAESAMEQLDAMLSDVEKRVDRLLGPKPVRPNTAGMKAENAIPLEREYERQLAEWEKRRDELMSSVAEGFGKELTNNAEIAKYAPAESGTAQSIDQTGKAAETATPKIDKYSASVSKGAKLGKMFRNVMNSFGKSIHKSNGFLSSFGQTLKRVVMRMLAMGLVRGVINGFTQGLKILAGASTDAEKNLGKFTTIGNSIKAALGSVALSVLNAFSGAIYNIASAAITAANAVARFFGALGNGTYYAVGMADSFEEVESAASGAGSAAKGMLAKFDELNVIGNKGGGGGKTSIGNTTANLEKAESVLAELFKSEQFEAAGNYVAKKLDGLLLKFDQFFIDLGNGDYGTKFAQFVNGIFDNKQLWSDAGKTAGDGVNSVFRTLYGFFKTFDAGEAADSLALSINTALQTTDWMLVGKTAVSGLESALEFVSRFLLEFDYLGVINSIAQIVSGHISELLSNPTTLIRLLGNMVLTVFRILTSITVSSLTTLMYTLAGTIEPLLPGAAKKITEWADAITGGVNTMFDNIADGFDGLIDDLEESYDKGRTIINRFEDRIMSIPDKTVRITTVYDSVTTGTSSRNVLGVGANLKMIALDEFASGGIVYGNTIANVGEYADARSNPEVIAPLSDLQGILARSGASGDGKALQRQNELLSEQNALLRQIANKEIKIAPSAAFGQVVAKSNELYARA